MLFSLNGKVYTIDFSYGVTEAKTRKGIVTRRVTLAELKVATSEENGKPVWESTGLVGIAECSEKDRFSKWMGRKVSLSHLVKEMEVDGILTDKNMNAFVWFVYYTRNRDDVLEFDSNINWKEYISFGFSMRDDVTTTEGD